MILFSPTKLEFFCSVYPFIYISLCTTKALVTSFSAVICSSQRECLNVFVSAQVGEVDAVICHNGRAFTSCPLPALPFSASLWLAAHSAT